MVLTIAAAAFIAGAFLRSESAERGTTHVSARKSATP